MFKKHHSNNPTHIPKFRVLRAVTCIVAVLLIVSLAVITSNHNIKETTATVTAKQDKMTKKQTRLLATIHIELKNQIDHETTIVLELLPEAAPKTVAQFVRLSESGFYNGTSFYRAEPNFCLQGGAWARKDAAAAAIPKLPLEYNTAYPNALRAVSMARMAQPNTASTEFSIMLGDNAKWLGPGGSDPYGYAVFARVVGGWDTTVARLVALPSKKDGLTFIAEPRPVITSISITRENVN
eukprot:PhM_4_TR16708/c0_g1_i1/m.87170/K03767/PPIA; peptidyl-prolyl cis-trans isomerase A (cyclophilin A)